VHFPLGNAQQETYEGVHRTERCLSRLLLKDTWERTSKHAANCRSRASLCCFREINCGALVFVHHIHRAFSASTNQPTGTISATRVNTHIVSQPFSIGIRPRARLKRGKILILVVARCNRDGTRAPPCRVDMVRPECIHEVSLGSSLGSAVYTVMKLMLVLRVAGLHALSIERRRTLSRQSHVTTRRAPS
jgi:hypothetical protein